MVTILSFFAEVGERHIASYLTGSSLDYSRLRSDPVYGMQAFLSGWAYERSGATRNLRIAAVKAVHFAGQDLNRIGDVYRQILHGKPNARNNPALDSRLT